MTLWQTEGYKGLHRFGWQEAALDVEYLIAAILLLLALAGLAAVVFALVENLLL
jgi:hypothetical protein